MTLSSRNFHQFDTTCHEVTFYLQLVELMHVKLVQKYVVLAMIVQPE